MSERMKTEILLAQYKEAYEYLRQHSRFMWQVHSLATVISGGLIVASFAYVDLWWVRDFVLAIASVVTISLFIAMKKHRYFANSEVWTLSHLEDTLRTKRIQRTTRINQDRPREDNSEPEYWNVQKPEDMGSRLEVFFAKRGADRWLGNSLLGSLFMILVCIVINTVIGVIS